MGFRLHRRTIIAASGIPALPHPCWSARERSFVFGPREMPESLDPIATPSFATRTAAMAVFETLYGQDSRLNPSPQMVQAHRMEQGGARWTMALRSGLTFHDGTPVTARDCVASLHRWMRRDEAGAALAARLELLDAPDTGTLTIRLRKPLPELPLFLTKSQLSPPVIMPANLAGTDPARPVDPPIGSGPFRLDPGSWRAGEAFDLVRHADYQPRLELSTFTSGRRMASVDRILWRRCDDPAAALRDGRADWVESLPPDLADDAIASPAITVERLDDVGQYAMLRMNPAWGPGTDRRIRQAILAAIDPIAVMEAVFGANSGKFLAPVGLFRPESEWANDTGTDRIGAKRSTKSIAAMIRDAGYRGDPLIMINPIDDPVHRALTAAVIEQLSPVGLTILERKLDGLAFRSWARTAATEGGAWSFVCHSDPGADHFDPIALALGGDPDMHRARAAVDAWIDAPDPRVRRDMAARVQEETFIVAPFVPLGLWYPTSAWRTTITGQQKGAFPVFWSIARTGDTP